MKKIDAVVVFSGGQDSTTCLAQALKDFPDAVSTLTFDYGQRHNVEIEQAKKIAALAGVPKQIIDLTLLSQLTPNALTHHDMKIEQKDGELPSTFVPGRNHIMLSFAAVVAYQLKAKHIYTGVCQTDYSGYPDCRDDFVKSLTNTVNLAMDYELEIHTPLMFLNKAESVKLMADLGHIDWLAHSHTCYEGRRPACGICPACQLRLNGFKEAGVTDPLEYEANR